MTDSRLSDPRLQDEIAEGLYRFPHPVPATHHKLVEDYVALFTEADSNFDADRFRRLVWRGKGA